MSRPHALHAFALELAESACKVIAGARPDASTHATKHDAADWVTVVDRAVETQVRARLHERFPDHAVVGEEFGASGDSRSGGYTWHMDPVDGTMNFVHGIPWVAFSLAVRDSEGLVAGVVADVYRHELYSAYRGGGARINGAPARCVSAITPAGGAFLTEWSRQAAWDGMEAYLRRISDAPAGTRIMGSCALALALVGVGRATGAVIPGVYNSWDVYAGGLIAREGGAAIHGRDGPSEDIPLDGVLAAPPTIAPWLWQAWNPPAR